MKIDSDVQEFYNITPFPDFSLLRFNNQEQLKLAASSLAHVFSRGISKDSTVIDIGCGTGQLSALLSLNHKKVLGIDFSSASLDKARQLKEKLKLDNLEFMHIDITSEASIAQIRPQFDCLLCLGVLHHTSNVYKSFQNIVKLVKPGGKVAIGLYNKYGRLPLKIRKLILKLTGENEKIKKVFMRLQLKDLSDPEKLRGWYNDQYRHIHETAHTVREVIKWFKAHNIEYNHCYPDVSIGSSCDFEMSGFWFKGKIPNPLTCFLIQLNWIAKIHRDGGYWVTFGTKK